MANDSLIVQDHERSVGNVISRCRKGIETIAKTIVEELGGVEENDLAPVVSDMVAAVTLVMKKYE